ncbi:YjgP/YjgQ family permease [Synechococcus sp. RSCCF101]|uniref:LptF/LptG family permease n=1 Tax=Synechococcus sp. RSCCF101 TaxID=2511069 RepID=UPI0012467FA1|nr:LptF/LptG family permease [Synechococcus sp. RSCCF101]QEY31618.1 YjgP/YjgQ family permease [Synechococcus sp. RSCCF101]
MGRATLKPPRWLRPTIMDRWLVGELVGPLLFAIAAFTVVSLSVGVMFELVRRVVESGLPVTVAVEILGLRLPGFLVLSFPMATLMATLLAYSRLSGNSELTALRSVGLSTSRIVAPALAVALLMTGLTFVFNDVIVPRTNTMAEVNLRRALGKAIATEQGKNVVYSRFGRIVNAEDGESARGLVQLFYARRFDDGEMQGVTVLDFSRADTTQMLMAERGVWNEERALWEFRDGRVVTLTGEEGAATSANFDRYFYPLSRGPIEVAQLPDDAAHMTLAQARSAERLLLEAGDQKEARRLRVRIQEKFTLPMACLVFGLIGSSLGARPNARTSRSQGFGISVVLILIYYILSFSFSSLGVKGTLSPMLAAWSPVAISLGFGAVLLRLASR